MKTKPATLKIKLHRDLAVASNVYEQECMPFKCDIKGQTIKELFNWRCFLDEYMNFRPLVTPTQKCSRMEQLSTGEALSQ